VTTSPIATIVAELERFGIPHMVAGSFASTLHGEPRTTHDIDLVIDPDWPSLHRFAHELERSHFYVNEEAVREAWERRGQFNVVLLDSGWKVDLIIRKDRLFSRTEFERRQPATIGDAQVFVATAEDTIVAKLEWASRGESERQLRDVVGILGMSGDRLDVAYVERWVRELGLQEIWARAQHETS